MKYCPKCGRKLIKAEIGGRARLKSSSEACGYVYWDNPTPVVAAIVELDGKVVLTRSKGWPEKWHGLVAGFLEKGETPEDSVLREVKEELGLEGQIVDFVGYYSFTLRNQLIRFGVAAVSHRRRRRRPHSHDAAHGGGCHWPFFQAPRIRIC